MLAAVLAGGAPVAGGGLAEGDIGEVGALRNVVVDARGAEQGDERGVGGERGEDGFLQRPGGGWEWWWRVAMEWQSRLLLIPSASYAAGERAQGDAGELDTYTARPDAADGRAQRVAAGFRRQTAG